MTRRLAPLLVALAVAAAAPPSAAQERAPDTTPGDAVNDMPPAHTNRLAKESSPYLLQHAHNPVDWFPWGEEAFETARAQDKPVFLSIGYSTCHWCHVMERESFEDEGIAALLNEHFVSIKVDREERPDVDAVYMAAVTSLTGQGGWPLSVFLTPDRRPFFGGTYFPPEDRYGRPGFPTLLRRVAELWREDREGLEQNAQRLVEIVAERADRPDAAELTAETLEQAVAQYGAAYDAQWGGFGPKPKFPRAFSLSLLLRLADRGASERCLEMVTGTLDAIARGGIHDHLGGGFHRYATDREWLLPHFEKMLYDQSYLAQAFLDGWLVTGEARHAAVVRGTLDYLLRDLRDAAGGFHSAEDADSEGEEGKFYVWTRAEVIEALGPEDGALFCRVYEVREEGNFADEATGRRTGANVLHLRRSLAEHADGAPAEAFATRIAALRETLLALRSARVRPHKDDKVLTSWNGMAISALARAGAALGEPRYLEAAREAAGFLLEEMRREDGRLLHRWRRGDAGIDGFLDDSAFLGLGLLDLYEATLEPRWLAASLEIARQSPARFHDAASGGFHVVANDGEAQITRLADLYDGAEPSGNSAATVLLVRLGRGTGDAELLSAGRAALASWSGTIVRYPMGYPFALRALDLEIGPSREVVIAGDPAAADTRALLAEIRKRFLPRTALLLNVPGPAGDALRELVPKLAGQDPVAGRAAAYVCTDFACDAPVTSAQDLAAALDRHR